MQFLPITSILISTKNVDQPGKRLDFDLRDSTKAYYLSPTTLSAILLPLNKTQMSDFLYLRLSLWGRFVSFVPKLVI